jgi:hypothetical protein
VQGGSGLVAALGSVRRLTLSKCSSLGAAALASVAQLTRLTYLAIGGSLKGAGPAQLAQLAQLTNLQELRAWGHSIRGDAAAALLEMPSLGTLGADGVEAPHGQAACGSITNLVL